MTGRDRILKTLKGEKVDRVPIWLMGPFAREMDDDRESWTAKDSRYRELKKLYDESCEMFRQYRLPGCNRILATPQKHIQLKETIINGNETDKVYVIITPKGNLQKIVRKSQDIGTSWDIEYPVKNEDDLYKLLSVNFEIPEYDYANFYEQEKLLGNKGVMVVYVDTPMITLSTCMKFEDFLAYTMTDLELMKEATAVAFERIKGLIQKAIDAGLGPIYRIQGCEQATPPMSRFEVYNELIFNYEKQLIDMIHKSGNFAAVHCHGKIKTVLPKMLEMGVDLLDPVEPLPLGDITFDEAKKLVGGRMTLAGNIEFDDLEHKTPEQVEEDVKSLLADGKKDHVIIAASGWPLTYLTDNMYRNLKALIEIGLTAGRFDC